MGDANENQRDHLKVPNSTYVSRCAEPNMADNNQMECAQINVTGGSGSAKPATVSLPGAYSVRGVLLTVIA